MASRRPPDRKALIRSAASDLFLRHGYHNVSVAEVTAALDLTPAALYHHYRTKRDLLLHAVLDGFDTVDAAIREAGDLDTALRSLAALVAGPKSLLSVWERESRNLEGSQRLTVLERRTGIVTGFAPLLRAERTELDAAGAELVARAVLGALGGQSRRSSVSRREDERLMVRLASAVARCPLPAAGPSPRPDRRPGDGAASGVRRPRRDRLLTEAIRLFDERGYQSVTVADIGEAAGIVASGVYRHFAGKTDMLVAAMNRGGEHLRTGADRALAHARDPREAVELLLGAHIDVTVKHRHLVGILIHESAQLPDRERVTLRRYQADYLDVWVQALGAARTDRDAVDLRTTVQSAHSMIHFAVRSEPALPGPALTERLAALGTALLLGE
ncbi:TetR/AcrR family transcriptional regulator [Streptomyces sp. NPDC014894]|uniref:TetR/AcrR family transcriptional regulator n=1 Tax=Streptomyces sp. NPDC014894 TaxID=3364931 RepID=UPI0036FFFA13